MPTSILSVIWNSMQIYRWNIFTPAILSAIYKAAHSIAIVHENMYTLQPILKECYSHTPNQHKIDHSSPMASQTNRAAHTQSTWMPLTWSTDHFKRRAKQAMLIVWRKAEAGMYFRNIHMYKADIIPCGCFIRCYLCRDHATFLRGTANIFEGGTKLPVFDNFDNTNLMSCTKFSKYFYNHGDLTFTHIINDTLLHHGIRMLSVICFSITMHPYVRNQESSTLLYVLHCRELAVFMVLTHNNTLWITAAVVFI